MLNVQVVETIHAEELENALYVYSPYTWDQYESSVFIHHTQVLFTHSFVKDSGKVEHWHSKQGEEFKFNG